MEPNEILKMRQELRKKLRAEEVYKKVDSKRFLKQAVLNRGGERLQEEMEQAQRQLEQEQRLEDEQRAFGESQRATRKSRRHAGRQMSGKRTESARGTG